MRRVNALLRRIPPWSLYAATAAWSGWVFWQALTGAIGVDPVRALEHETGLRALQLLILGLAITPLRRFIGLDLMRFRRAVGLAAFGLVVFHLVVWIAFDIGFVWRAVLADLVKRPYVTVGMAGFALLLPLAVTSNAAAIRRMGGPAWRRLHRLAYPAGLAGGMHYLMVVKSWPMQPVVYLGVILALLGLRLIPNRQKAQRIN